jgi:hypothetical protein
MCNGDCDNPSDCPKKYWNDLASLKKHLEKRFGTQPPSGEIVIYYLCGTGKATEPEKGKDTDGDTVPDEKDDCPDTPGRVNCNGCPDSDFDLIPDKDDKCPEEPGLVKLGGCKETKDKSDSDNDGIKNDMDECPNDAGTLQCKGCPDSDRDGVSDKDDKCKNVKGVAENFGCPQNRTKIVHNNKLGLFTVENYDKNTMILKVFFTTLENRRYEITPEKIVFPSNKGEFDRLNTTLMLENGSGLKVEYVIFDKGNGEVLNSLTLTDQSLVCMKDGECGIKNTSHENLITTSPK